MTVSMLLAIGALGAGALVDIVYKFAQERGTNSATFILYQSTVFSSCVWITLIAKGQLGQIHASTWLIGLPFGLLSYIGVLLFMMSLRAGRAGVNAPIFRLSFVLTSIGAVLFLGEGWNIPKVLGIGLASLAVLSLADISAARKGQAGHARSFVLLAGAVLAMGVAGVLNKEALNLGNLTVPLIAVSNIAFTPSALVGALATHRLKPDSTTLRFAPFTGVLQLLWALLVTESLQTGDASINFPIVNLSFVLTAFLAVTFLREPANRRLFLGVGIAVIAVLSFSFA